jgi:hypothetical protein
MQKERVFESSGLARVPLLETLPFRARDVSVKRLVALPPCVLLTAPDLKTLLTLLTLFSLLTIDPLESMIFERTSSRGHLPSNVFSSRYK